MSPRSRSVAVVGGGFGGVGAATMLKRAGYDDVTVFERGERIGGVWHANTYPGAACDIPSHLYEFSFAPNPRWSRRYAPQAEIQAYLEDTARRYGVLDRIRTSTEVRSAAWDEQRRVWRIETSAGPHEAEVLLTACGQLSVPTVPPLPGLDDFAGPAFHTARWRHDVDLAGKRVAVIGTGCSAIQVVPAIQPEVAQVDVYQRSPGWTFPKMDFPYSERTQRMFERFPVLQRLDRQSVFLFQELAAAGMTKHRWLLRLFKLISKRRIDKAIADPELRRRVTPTDEIGCKRIMLTDEWYPTLTKPNVELVADRIAAVTPGGIRTQSGVTAAMRSATSSTLGLVSVGYHSSVSMIRLQPIRGRGDPAAQLRIGDRLVDPPLRDQLEQLQQPAVLGHPGRGQLLEEEDRLPVEALETGKRSNIRWVRSL